MQKAIITIGCSGSGKTTWANQQKGFCVVSRDDVRKDIYFEQTRLPFEWKNWKWKNEAEVTKRCDMLLIDHYRNGHNIIVADTNLNKDRMIGLENKLANIGYDVELKYFHGIRAEEDISIETCLKRDSQRALSVGFDVIHKQWKQMIDSYGNDIIQQYVPDKTKPKAILVDLDGTLCKMNGRGPFEWDKVGLDTPNFMVADLVDLKAKDGTKIILLSGRDSVCRDKTLMWLDSHAVPYDYLWMRVKGDSRRDSIIKLELFDQHIRDNFYVLYAIDDRKQMIQLYTDIGLPVMNVGHINEYF